MRFSVSFKTPDAVHYALQDLDAEGYEESELSDLLEKFIEHGECITVQFDTEKGTATVLPVKD